MSLLINRYPFAEFENLFKNLDRSLESAWRNSTASNVAMDVYEKPDAFFIRALLPGVVEEDVVLSVEKDVVTLKGTIRCDYQDEQTKVYLLETPYGAFTRSIRLPESSDAERAEATLDLGVLTVRIPKAEAPAAARNIQIKRSIPTTAVKAIEGKPAAKGGTTP